MQRLVTILVVLIACAALFAVTHEAFAKTVTVKLSSEQVANVCGKNIQTGGGHTGCTKNCGQYICDYDCNNKTKQCGGQCVTCPQRKFPWGDRYWIHIVSKSVKAAQ